VVAKAKHVFVDSSGRPTELDPDTDNEVEYKVTSTTVRLLPDGNVEFKHYVVR
jgi:hypothetical protein